MRTRQVFGAFGSCVLFLLVLCAGRGQAAGDSAVVTAAKSGDVRAMRALIARRANVNEPASDGSTPLLWAVYNGDLDMTRALIAGGAAVNTANKYGVTPLLQASRTGDAPLIAALLKAGANPKLAHPDGETALMATARAGRIDAVGAPRREGGSESKGARHHDHRSQELGFPDRRPDRIDVRRAQWP
jgi:ankyrin repeat protein